ncbi:ABC transporter permease [uncultured Acetatifactor sp.]|uniref:ABC transporter permease n=1 Tax=uncultured Acetatifactor sp. TaxID=1671927 RepID=UPI0026020EB6|nr:FtsX-like permease family protein [uncultured Acetatifactor sp.]
MNGFRLAWRSVIRKPVKSILLFVTVFTISLLLLSGMSSGKATIQMQDNTRQAIGAGLLLEENEADRHRRIDALTEQLNHKEGTLGGYHQEIITLNGVESWRTWTDNSFETLLVEDIEKIADTEGIADYNITTVATAVRPVDFIRIEDEDVDQYSDLGGVSLIGNRDMSMDSNFLSGNAFITEGRMIETGEKDVCVISAELAEKNQLEVGNRIRFGNCRDKKDSAVHEAEIVGIYQVNQPIAPYMFGDTYRSENIIFTDLDFPEKADGKPGDPLYEKAYFKIADVNEYEAVKIRVMETDIAWERYDLIDNNGNMNTLSANFNEMEKYSKILVWVISGASLIILFLIFQFWMKSRNREIGIMLSMGTSKMRILAQIMAEALMIAAAAVLISFSAAPKVSGLTADYLVEQQIQSAEEQDLLNQGKVAFSYEQSEQSVVGVRAEITSGMLAQDASGIALLITISVCVSGIAILKRNPRDILQNL